MEDVRRKIQHDFLPALTAEVAVWPGIQAINFWKVPLEYQLLVVNALTVLDASFMSWVQHNDLLEKVQSMWAKVVVDDASGNGGTSRYIKDRER